MARCFGTLGVRVLVLRLLFAAHLGDCYRDTEQAHQFHIADDHDPNFIADILDRPETVAVSADGHFQQDENSAADNDNPAGHLLDGFQESGAFAAAANDISSGENDDTTEEGTGDTSDAGAGDATTAAPEETTDAGTNSTSDAETGNATTTATEETTEAGTGDTTGDATTTSATEEATTQLASVSVTKVLAVIRKGLIAMIDCILPLREDPPNTDESLNKLQDGLWKVVDVDDDAPLELKAKWDAAFASNRPEIKAHYKNWSESGELVQLTKGIAKVLVLAEDLVQVRDRTVARYFSALGSIVSGVGEAWSYFLQGEVATAVREIASSTKTAVFSVLPDLEDDEFLAILKSLDEPFSQLTSAVLSYRQNVLSKFVCYKRMMTRPRRRPHVCEHAGWEYNGIHTCLPGIDDGRACFDECGKESGMCPEFCGSGKACCKKGSKSDAYECKKATGFVDHFVDDVTPEDYHQCVRPGPPLPEDMDCWDFCHGYAGPCGACGEDGQCLREDLDSISTAGLVEMRQQRRAAASLVRSSEQSVGSSTRGSIWPFSSGSNNDPNIALSISEAGSEIVNGVWVVDDFKNGHPRYTKRGDSDLHLEWKRKSEQWQIWRDDWGFWGDTIYYASGARLPTAPTEEWIAVQGDMPPPKFHILDTTVVEHTGSSKKPAQGGNYRCKTVDPASSLLVVEEQHKGEAQHKEVMSAAKASDSASQVARGTESTERGPLSPRWCFWCSDEEIGGVPAVCDMDSEYAELIDEWCYAQCPEGFIFQTELRICNQECLGHFPAEAQIACGTTPTNVAQAVTESTAAASIAFEHLSDVLSTWNDAGGIADLNAQQVEDSLHGTLQAMIALATAFVKPLCPLAEEQANQ